MRFLQSENQQEADMSDLLVPPAARRVASVRIE